MIKFERTSKNSGEGGGKGLSPSPTAPPPMDLQRTSGLARFTPGFTFLIRKKKKKKKKIHLWLFVSALDLG